MLNGTTDVGHFSIVRLYGVDLGLYDESIHKM